MKKLLKWCSLRVNIGKGGEVAKTMYTHVSKCTNNKIKGEKIVIIGNIAQMVECLPIILKALGSIPNT
jgi:hypothetical protein